MKKRRTGWLLICLLLTVGLFATGVQEGGPLILGVQNGDYEVTWAEDGEFLGPESGVFYYKDIVFKDYPGEVQIRAYAQDNTTIKLDADIAGGDPPDVYYDYLGRVNKYANSKFAVPIDLNNEANYFIPSYLEQLTKDGILYGIPETAWAAVMIVNKTLLESAGAGDLIPADDDPDRSWSTDDFLLATSMVQEKYGSDYYGYALFAAGTGGDYWSSFGWIAGHGAKLYENGEIVIGRPEGIQALEFMDMMHETGVVMPGAAGLTYAENLGAMARGDTVAMGGVAGHGEQPFELTDGSGTIDPIIMEYPHAEGVESVPITVGPNAGMCFLTGDPEREAQAIDLLRWMTSERIQTYNSVYGSRFASRKGIPAEGRDSAAWSTVNKMIAQNGIFDMGVGLESYSEVRELWPPTLQAIFSGELTVAEAVDRFITEGNKILE